MSKLLQGAVAWSTIPAVATAPNNAACLEKT